MKISLLAFLSVLAVATAFAPAPITLRTTTSLFDAPTLNRDSPELQAAIADVRAAASEFSDETLHFANVWIDRMLEGKQEGVAAGLLEECVLDDSEKCQRYSAALTKLDTLLGVGMQEQF